MFILHSSPSPNSDFSDSSPSDSDSSLSNSDSSLSNSDSSPSDSDSVSSTHFISLSNAAAILS